MDSNAPAGKAVIPNGRVFESLCSMAGRQTRSNSPCARRATAPPVFRRTNGRRSGMTGRRLCALDDWLWLLL